MRKRQKPDRLQTFLGDLLKFLSVFFNSLTRKRPEICIFFVVSALNAIRAKNQFFPKRNVIRSTEKNSLLELYFSVWVH